MLIRSFDEIHIGWEQMLRRRCTREAIVRSGGLRFQVPYSLLSILILLIDTLIYLSGMPEMRADEKDIFFFS